MNKWVSVRHVAVKENESFQIDPDEDIISVEYDAPYLHCIIIRVSYKRLLTSEEHEQLLEDSVEFDI